MKDIGGDEMILIPYVGSKERLYEVVHKNIPPHNLYIEPFAGGFSLGLRLIQNGDVKNAVLNDINSSLISFWRSVKFSVWDLMDSLDQLQSLYRNYQGYLSSFEFERKLYSTVTDEVTLAALYFVHKKLAKGKASGSLNRPMDFDVAFLTDKLIQAHNLLQIVKIENKSFECLGSYNSEDSFWYLDPPYWGYDGFYEGLEGNSFNHEALFDFCKDLKGKFILSYDDTEYIRDLYKKDFNIYTLNVYSKLSMRGYSEELLISNMDLDLSSYADPKDRNKLGVGREDNSEVGAYSLTLRELLENDDIG